MREILLSQSKIALVDDEDYDMLMQYKWYAQKQHRRNNCYYAKRIVPHEGTTAGCRLMHIDIMQPPPGYQVDHKDHNGLDNRKQNLRLATRSQNVWNRNTQRNNTSGYKGVSYSKACHKYKAMIGAGGESIYLGVYPTPEQAHLAYCEAAERLHGDFANFGNPIPIA